MTESRKRLLSLVVAQGNLMFNNKKRKSINEIIQIGILCKKKRESHEKIVGYVDLTNRYLSDDFKAHFRMTRTTMELLITAIGNVYKICNKGRPAESIKVQCLVTVWVLANQESYRSIADRFGISKSTVFNCLTRICECLNKFGKNLITWPRGNRVIRVMYGFYSKRSFPGVIGAIDGCHIDIKAPTEDSHAYVNRKGRTSMLLQAVCDHEYLFTDCYVGFPGSVHDARVFNKSGMLERCNNIDDFPYDSHILGDSAYPLKRHILVPFKDNGHLSRRQIKYNVAHAATRSTIERAFGMLKGRWRRLFYLELHCSDNLPSTISAACVLHNFCIKNNDTVDIEDTVGNYEVSVYKEINDDDCPDLNKEGITKRNNIAASL